jgi:site-specific DNA recombinase
MTRAAIYARISSDREDLRLGVDRQQKDCRLLCKERGWDVADTYTDNDMSAADPKKKRPEYDRMMVDVAHGRVDAVVVYKDDRLHRRPFELEEFFQKCDLVGLTKMASVSGQYDLSNADDVFRLRIMGNVAALEVSKIRGRVQRKKLDIAECGGFAGGRRPFGFDSDGVTHNEVEATLIREAARRVLEGDSLRSIRVDWTERGVQTVSNKSWSHTMLKRVLIQPRTAGLRQHQDEWSWDRPAAWDAILDRATWEQVRAVLMDPSRRRPPPSRRYPLTGILLCSGCGSYLKAMPRAGRRGYGCKKETGGCGHIFISADRVEKYVFGIMVPLADSPDLRDAVRADEAGQVDEARALVTENAADERMLGQLDADYADQVMPRPTYLTQSQRLRARIEDRTNRLSALRGRSALDRLGGQVRDHWAAMSADDRRLITSSLITKIEVSRTSKPGSNVFDIGRLKIEWRYDVVKDRNQYFGIYEGGGAGTIQWGIR